MSAAETVFESIGARGGDLIDAPITIEASIPLELSGEVVRNRICTFTDENGLEWALRPDLTLPVAQAELAVRQNGEPQETLRHYRGPVFRLPTVPNEPIEYEQVGLERFGAARGVEEDVWLFETLAQACNAAGVTTGATAFGDLAIFPAFVEALGLPDDVVAGLKRAFRQAGGVRAFLAGHAEAPRGLTGRLAGMERADVSAFVDDILAMTQVQPVGERSTDEIVERLYRRAQSVSGVTLSDEVNQLLETLLSVDTALADAPDALKALAESAGLRTLSDTLDNFAKRTARLLETPHAGLLKGARFATRFGRRFTYYDGFVFEISAGSDASATARPFAAGGRYDSLLSDLSGGAVNATAIGGIIIPHRLAELAGADS